LPEAFGWYVERVFPVERRVVRALRPALSRWTKVPMPQDNVFDAVTRLHRELAEVRAVLCDPTRASVRLVRFAPPVFPLPSDTYERQYAGGE